MVFHGFWVKNSWFFHGFWYNKKLGNIVAKDNVRYNSEENKLRFLATEINSNIDFTIINADNIRARLAEDSYLRGTSHH